MKTTTTPDKSLKGKAIDIKGKAYVMVNDRVLYFNERYNNGSIDTELISEPTAGRVVIKATVTPDIDKPQRTFTGYSQATWGDGMVNKGAALENAETSAVGRALGMMGIGVIDGIASVDEIKKAEQETVMAGKSITPQKQTMILTMLKSLKQDPANFEKRMNKTIDKMTNVEADDAISRMEAVIARRNAEEVAANVA